MPKILLMLFGWIMCGQEQACFVTAPSRKSETIPGCWRGGCGSSDPLSSWRQLLTCDFPALTLMPSVYMNKNRSIWRVLVKYLEETRKIWFDFPRGDSKALQQKRLKQSVGQTASISFLPSMQILLSLSKIQVSRIGYKFF